MKKLICAILSVILAAMCCTALADEYPEPEGGKKFNTNWAIFGMTVEIDYEEEGYRVYIKASDPHEKNGTEWEYSCFYNAERDELISISSSKNPWYMDPATGESVRGEYEYQGFDDEGQETTFRIDEDGYLTWQDGRGEAGADLVFSDIGAFKGFWKSEDGKIYADIEWCDSEIGDEYGYNVFLHDEGEESYAEYVLHGLYSRETGKLETTGSVTIYRLKTEGGYDTEEIPADPAEPLEIIFSNMGGGRILLERDNGYELVYDFMGGDSNG